MANEMSELRVLSDRRRRVVTALTIAMVIVYFGFIALVAFGRGVLAALIVPGLSIGILLGALVIVSAWGLTYFYIHWANAVYDPTIERLRR
jgi:uncharacterized membrane protein (DUF485 family)